MRSSMVRARWVMAVSMGLLGLGAGASPVQAQAAAGGGPVFASIPLAQDLKKVPVGTWAEYRVDDGSGGKIAIRLVLTGRHGALSDIETSITGGPVAAIGKSIMRSSIDSASGADANPNEHVVQMGDNPPMLIPGALGGGQTQSFRRVDPKTRVGVDPVTVPGGTFAKAEHHQQKLESGAVVDSWLSKDAPPFGLVKLSAGFDPHGKPVAMELTAHGTGAKPGITAKPQPFDQTVLMKQLQPLIAAQQAAMKKEAAKADAKPDAQKPAAP